MTTTQAPAELTTAQAKALAALTEHPGATAREIAEHAGIGGSTAGKALTHLESLNLATREHGENVGGRGGRRTADRWYPVTADAEPEAPAADEPETPAEDAADTAPEPAEAPVAETKTEAAPKAKARNGSRLGRGDLRQMVYEYLEAHPADEIGPSGLAKALGRSAGAVANALAKLADHGQAELVSDSPRRYRLK
ncbi:MarR family transcriptional regulator (plasmid) [Streptomyces sp. NA02950]|uniref:MarR family transcriptional regulator n=1 Tax=Streptomyces sp. NA02950 TaxID=2742137 RepID=UPI0015922AE2|nr:MarR family transcriptional regulator [Streptomyces sp. NA02950]QKV98150.1 MarR family transcriptional regulator [Streptomyces sp. NA02950]